MPEEDRIKTHLAAIAQIYSLEICQRNEKIAALQRKLTEKDDTIVGLQALVAELQEITRYATALDLVSNPTILTRPDNTIQFVNDKMLDASRRSLSDILNKPLANIFLGVEFLDQIRLHPLLMQVEDLSALAYVPITLVTPQGEQLLSSAEINFLTPLRAYHGVRLALKPKEGRTLFQKTRKHLRRYLGGTSKYDDELDAHKYAQHNRLSVRDKPVEKDAPLDGTILLTEITKRVLELDNPDYHRRRVLVNLQSIDSCDPRFYQTLLAISQMKGLPLACIVYEDSEPHRELLNVGFSEKNIVKERKKKK